jgi:ribosome biogenesis protein UTP30
MADEKQLEKIVKRASTSLLEFIQNGKSSSGKQSLFDAGDVLSGQTVQLIVGLKKIPEQGRTKPITLPIPHSLYRPEDGASMCMFVKDNSDELKQKLQADPVDGLERVISLSALRRNYKEFKDRRKLVASHDLFLADDRITPMLTKTLGKTFLSKKKQPVPIRLNRGSLKRNIEQKRNSTYLFLGWGACCSVKVGRTDFTSKQVAENTMAAIHGLVQKVPRKWKNIQSMHLKSTDSIALPIYNALPDANVAMAIVAESDGKTSKRAREEDNEEAEVVVGKKKKTTKKQKKQKTAVGDRFASLQKAESDSKSRKKR